MNIRSPILDAGLLLAGLSGGPAMAGHNSPFGEGFANMPNDIHNTRIDTREDDDNETFVDLFRFGGGASTYNRFFSTNTGTTSTELSAPPGRHRQLALTPDRAWPHPVSSIILRKEAIMKIKLVAVILASGLAVASTLVEARGPGGGQSTMGGGYGNAPTQTQQGNMSPGRTEEQDRTRTEEQDRTRTEEQDRTRSQEQDRTRTQDQDRVKGR